MLAYWTSFARCGVPSAPNAPDWPPFASPADTMRFTPAQITPFDAAAAHNCAFWQELYPELLDRS
jgi:para-nitrobenzyl esterase